MANRDRSGADQRGRGPVRGRGTGPHPGRAGAPPPRPALVPCWRSVSDAIDGSGPGSGLAGSGGDTSAYRSYDRAAHGPGELPRSGGACWLEPQGPQAGVQDTGAERAGSAGNHAFGDGGAMLRTEILPGPDDGGSGPGEPFDESSVVSRSVKATLGQSGGNRNWCYGNRADVLPELTLSSPSTVRSPVKNCEFLFA